MLEGGFEGTVDGKGRIVLPAKLRNNIGEAFHIMKGFGGYVAIYPEENYSQMVGELMNMKKSSDEYLSLARYLLGSSFEGEADANGRVLIPTVLRKFAGLEKEIVILGAGDHAEIWDSEKFQENLIKSTDSLSESKASMNY